MNKDYIEKRIYIIGIIIIFLFLIIILRISYLQLYNNKESVIELERLSIKTVYGDPLPRGKIYDRNYNLLVGNKDINILSYKKEKAMTDKDEIKLAYLLAKNIDISYKKLTTRALKEFYLINNPTIADKKITKKEYELYERRKLTLSEIYDLKIKRVTEKELSKYNDIDKESAYIYYLMHNGYSYDKKLIKTDLTEEEYEFLASNLNNLKGFSISKSWERYYPYNDVLKQILGNVSTYEQGIPKEYKTEYLSKGYELDDRVGLSYLEYQYEDELKGKKDKYEVKNGKKTLVEYGKNGNDIILSIDINLQMELENILKEELLKAKDEFNTKYYDHSSVVITNPNTGEILALASKKIKNTKNGYEVVDNTSSILTSSNTLGSVVKGASMLVGYKTGNLNIGDVFYDKCIKFKNTPEKCSWKNGLGALNDIKALTYSSNSYQFQLALKVAGVNYYRNMPLKIDSSTLEKYRLIFGNLGLGSKSEIDLPNETSGYKGNLVDAGLLLNYSIGQYDTYSILQLSSYMNTIINNGKRYKLNLVNEIRHSTKDNTLGSIKYTYEPKLLNEVILEEKYFLRVKEGFASVMTGYLGKGYMGNSNVIKAGKTGTSESFYDSDLDNKVDVKTYTKTFVGYAPYEKPSMSIAVISPHVSYENNKNNYISNVNKRITSRICNKFFENYK